VLQPIIQFKLIVGSSINGRIRLVLLHYILHCSKADCWLRLENNLLVGIDEFVLCRCTINNQLVHLVVLVTIEVRAIVTIEVRVMGTLWVVHSQYSSFLDMQ
jgi:hypothetical protein